MPVFAPERGNVFGHDVVTETGEGTRSHGDPVAVSRAGVEQARRSQHDVVIVDTAGRLAIDADLMQQAADIRAAIQPDEVLFVIDAMIGQAAVETAHAFQEGVDVTGVVLTKLDGDARGGAALSVASVTGRPIMFASTGEGVKDFEVFHPDRMASRILDMGDVLTLIEQAEKAFDRTHAAEMERKFLAAEDFTFDDFLQQMAAIKKMGSLKSILGMMPGMGQMKAQLDAFDEREFDRVEAMVRSMTPFERNHPKQINGSRRARIAKGSGVTHLRGQPAARALRRRAEDDEAARPRRRRCRGCRGCRVAGPAPASAGASRRRSARSPSPGTRPSARPSSARHPSVRRPPPAAPSVPARPPARPAPSTRRRSTPPTCRRASRSSWASDPGARAGGLHTMTVGTAGPRVAFLHGLFGQGRNWTQIAKAVAGPDGTRRPLPARRPARPRPLAVDRATSPTRRMPPASPRRSRPRRRGSRGCSSGTRSAARSRW